ncbi:MAG: hypothetical protein ABI432_09090 [Flavobacteriales bacterium]
MRTNSRSGALAALVLIGCASGDDPNDPVVARAFDQQLHWSDLRQVVPVEVSPEDSAATAQAYITNWLHQQVELRQAEKNLAASQKEFENELKDYRNSLLLFAYEQALVRQKLDTVIGAQEVQDYYDQHRENFELKDNIVRVRWFKVTEEDRRALKRMEERFLSGNSDQMHEIELWLAQHGLGIIDRTDTWTNWTDLRNEIPLDEAPAQDQPNGQRFVVKQGPTAWFVDILERRSKGAGSPQDIVRQDIRSILINQRKLHLIERMREDLYREAQDARNIEVL